MPDIPRRLKLLDRKLAALPDDCEPMLVTELEGFLTGIIVCPELIMPGEWLPMIWGGEDDDSAPVFADTGQMEEIVGLIMEHYNATVMDLIHGRFAPVFDIDTASDEVIWETWIEGFETALSLRPQSWAPVMEADEDTVMAFCTLVTLADLNRGESDLVEAQRDDLSANGHRLIPICVETLNAWRLRQRVAEQPPAAPVARVGRNAPCPCGSGKKYKKCCGRN